MTDYYDINNWKKEPVKFLNYIKGLEERSIVTKRILSLKVSAVRLYSLLKSKISTHPNGIYTTFQQGKPLDNMIWWDFVLESNIGFVHIWRTTRLMEATYSIEGLEFDVTKFLYTNISKYSVDIEAEILKFEKHTLYTNHFSSYKKCVDYLWKDIQLINLSPPISPDTHFPENNVYQNYVENIQHFTDNSVKFHTLGKSLVLNAAFTIESYLNLVIRVGAKEELRLYSDILKKYLNNTFTEKLKGLRFYSIILKQDLDLDHPSIKNALELMTIRNKYVHSDESSSLNKVGEVYFDDDFPLQPISKDSPTIEAIIEIYHRPNCAMVKKAYDSMNNFISYIQSCFISEYENDLIVLMETNPIGFNETKKIYSSVSNNIIIDFYAPLVKKTE